MILIFDLDQIFGDLLQHCGWDGKKRSSGVMVADLDDLVKGMEPFVLMNTKACCEV